MNLDRTPVRRLLAAGSACLLTVALAGPFAGSSANATPLFPTTVALPNGFLPEGITIDADAQAYFGSRANGDIWGIDLRTGEGYPVSAGPGTSSVGLKVDGLGRLFVAGGAAGDGRVVDAATGAVLASYQFATAPTFVNDVVLTPDAAWFTDSQRAQLYKLPLGPEGALPDPAAVVTLPLTGDWQQVLGFNANGITRTPDEQALLVVNSASGLLYRVDTDDGVATVVELAGASVSSGDGMLLVRGRTLLVVRNQLNQISVIRLSEDAMTGELTGTITNAGFDIPTTIARYGNRLYLPNARFSTPPTPDTAYWVTQVSMKELPAG